ncbi:MAG: sensor histidine kinase [Nannocystaceae bacterium]
MSSTRASANITLRTFVFARWVLLGMIACGWAIQLLDPVSFALILSWFPPPPEPGGTAAVMVVLALANLATMRWVLGPGRATPNIAGLHLVLDATGLTALLALSGGVMNSFTTMLFVPITLATQISPRWTWGLAFYSLAGFAGLFLLTPDGSAHAGHGHDFAAHIRGMWVAFGISGCFMTYFVQRIAQSLARQRAELTRLRDQANQDRHLAAMGTLAAGAAHELGSPLGTIGMLVTDLGYMDEVERGDAVSTIKQEVKRCKHIIHQMASPELRLPNLAAHAPSWAVAGLAEDLRAITSDAPISVTCTKDVQAIETTLPKEVLGQILRELVANGAAACSRRPASRVGVKVEFSRRGEELRIDVVDDGIGMDRAAVEAAFDPFFSTKPEGEGMGLGLYLARAHLRQLGGSVELSSQPDSGTKIHIAAPLWPEMGVGRSS